MQQAALTDIFSNLDRASPTSTEVLRAQTQTLAVQSKWYLGFPPGREQQAVLARRHRFCTECCCPREPLCPPELCSPAGQSPLPRAAGKGWEHCRGASYSPCTVSLQTSGQCPRTQTCLSVCPSCFMLLALGIAETTLIFLLGPVYLIIGFYKQLKILISWHSVLL